MLPEYEDLAFQRRTGTVYYNNLLKEAARFMDVIDIGEKLIEVEDLKSIYSNLDDGGHYNRKGNWLVAESLADFIGKKGLLERKKAN